MFRDGSAKKPTAWALRWTTRGRSVVVQSSPVCTGNQVLDRAELLRVAESLRPA